MKTLGNQVVQKNLASSLVLAFGRDVFDVSNEDAFFRFLHFFFGKDAFFLVLTFDRKRVRRFD